MATLKIAKKVHFVICDDVRQEVGNKLSLMGIYNELILYKLPSMLRSFTIVIFLEKILLPFNKLIIKLELPEGKISEFTIEAPKGTKKGKNANLIVGISPIVINSEGEATISVRLPEDEDRKIEHIFNIKLEEQKK
jgi:hypothetical protein